LPFRANCGQDPIMEFEGKWRGRFEVAGEFVKRMKEIQEKTRLALKKA